jgi:hypothetical protein
MSKFKCSYPSCYHKEGTIVIDKKKGIRFCEFHASFWYKYKYTNTMHGQISFVRMLAKSIDSRESFLEKVGEEDA